MSRKSRKSTRNCLTANCLRQLPVVPGTTSCCVAHVNPHGEPCLDGVDQNKPGEDCTTWAVTFMAECDKLATIPEWQARNLAELDL